MLCHKVRAAKFVATISQFNIEELTRDCGEAMRSQLQVVRCGVLPEHLDVPRRSDPAQLLTILTIASLRDYKGLEYAIRAAALLADSLDFRWWVVGTGPDRDSLQRQIDAAGLHDRFQLIGGRSEQAIRDLLSEADLCVMSSVIMPDRRMEGIPVSLMESLAAGVPTIATRISGIPELVIDGVTGRLVPERDPEALADAIRAYCADRSAWQPMIEAGKAHIEREFMVDHNAARLQELFARSKTASSSKT
jgi:glycosyltransferase involved in cell wall biosynthesis